MSLFDLLRARFPGLSNRATLVLCRGARWHRPGHTSWLPRSSPTGWPIVGNAEADLAWLLAASDADLLALPMVGPVLLAEFRALWPDASSTLAPIPNWVGEAVPEVA